MKLSLLQKCNHAAAKDAKFLDVPLVIRDVNSLSGALDLFISPELLDGDNKYECEKCNQLCPALKGLQFKNLPYLLTIQLKRFDIDFELVN